MRSTSRSTARDDRRAGRVRHPAGCPSGWPQGGLSRSDRRGGSSLGPGPEPGPGQIAGSGCVPGLVTARSVCRRTSVLCADQRRFRRRGSGRPFWARDRPTGLREIDAPMCCQGASGGAGRPVMGHSVRAGCYSAKATPAGCAAAGGQVDRRTHRRGGVRQFLGQTRRCRSVSAGGVGRSPGRRSA